MQASKQGRFIGKVFNPHHRRDVHDVYFPNEDFPRKVKVKEKGYIPRAPRLKQRSDVQRMDRRMRFKILMS